jgi:nicotinate-nucleotide adenylyltransferase
MPTPTFKQPMGILGGTFDPVHFGHLRMAVELLQALDLSMVRLIPCYQPVHRKSPQAPAEQRLAMLKEAIQSEPGLIVDSFEIDRKGPSYTIDTLLHLRQEHANTPLCIIMGIDALLSFSSWHKWEQILTLAHLVVAHRPHYQLPQTGIIADLLKERLIQNPSKLKQNLSGNILLHPVTALDISSTDIRKQIARGRNIRYLIPDNVYHYIKQHGTYSINKL